MCVCVCVDFRLEVSLNCIQHVLNLRNPQLHRSGPDGDRSVQAAEDTAPQQRSHLLLPVPDPAWPEVHPLSQCTPPRPEALQPAAQHHL